MPEECGVVGCCGQRCCEVLPSNDGDVGQLQSTGQSLVVDEITFNTSNQCTAGSPLGDCAVVQTPATELCVCRSDELTLGSVAIEGSRGLVLLAHRSVTITGTVTLLGGPGLAGPGATTNNAAAAEGLSGGNGGNQQGPQAIVPLVGGVAGQDACGNRQGGGGGGALQITAGVEIVVIGTINAGGGGGSGGGGDNTCLGGAGGGSGGAILLEAPTVTMSGILACNGGGGGGGGSNKQSGSNNGAPGQGAALRAPGGEGRDDYGCALYGYTEGGDGGEGSVNDMPGLGGQASDIISGCLNGTTYVGGGGGGGGAGRIRVNSLGTPAISGTTSPSPSLGQVTLF